MTTFNKFNCFTTDLVNGVHNFSSDVFKFFLTNDPPAAASDTVRSDISELGGGNGYTSGGNATTISVIPLSGNTRVVGTNPATWTATGTVGPFQYAVLYNSSSVDALIGWYDYGYPITLGTSGTFALDVGGTNGIFTISASDTVSIELNNDNTFFVQSAGNDSNNGLSANRAFKTIAAAISAASLASPTSSKRINITVVGGGIYEESFTVPPYVNLVGIGAIVKGTVTVSNDASVHLLGVTPTANNNAFQVAGAGPDKYAFAAADFITLTGTGTGASNTVSGIWLTVDIGTINVDTGAGLGGSSSAGILGRVQSIQLNNSASVGITGSTAMRVTADMITQASGITTATGIALSSAGKTFVIRGNILLAGTAWNVSAAGTLYVSFPQVSGTKTNTTGTVYEGASTPAMDDTTLTTGTDTMQRTISAAQVKLGVETFGGAGGGGGTANVIDFSGTYLTTPSSAALIGVSPVPAACSLLLNSVNSLIVAETAPTAGTDILIKKNGSQIGTATFAANSHTGVVSGGSVSCARTDRIETQLSGAANGIAGISWSWTGSLV